MFGPSLDVRRNKYMWLGTDKVFEAFKFYICETPYGVMQVHGYPYDAGHSTFIVEMHDDVWRRAGFAESAGRVFPPGVSDEASIARVGELLRRRPRRAPDPGQQLQVDELHHGHATARWRHGNVVLLGDAAHTAHFSIGSGTKLAMEDALALVACLHEQPDVPSTALAAYEEERRPVVLSTQRAAQASLEWFENIGQYVGQDAGAVRVQHRHPQPADHLRQPAAARSGVRRADGRAGSRAGRRAPATSRPPMFQPYRLGAAGAGEPGRRLADGHVLRRRRHADRLPPGPPGRARRSAGPGW